MTNTGKRFAFIKGDIPDLAPAIMVVIVEGIGGTEGCVTDAQVCATQAEVQSYLDTQLGPDRRITWTRPHHPDTTSEKEGS